MIATWQSGVSPPDSRIIEDCRNWVRNVRWVQQAKGAIVPELNCRHGRRLAKRKVRKAAKHKAPLRPLPQLKLLLQHFDASTTPQQPEFNDLPIAKPPSDAEIDTFDENELRRRCRLLRLDDGGTWGELCTRLKEHFGATVVPTAAAIATASAATLAALGGLDDDDDSDDEFYMPRPEDDESDDEDDEELFRDAEGEWRRARAKHRRA
eukprot:COSAG06_NODE_10158_length_1738_cov_2.350214_1_plen_208_part_00